MIKENRIKIIISLIVTLLPTVFGLCFFNKILEAEHSNVANAKGVMLTAIVIIPLIMSVLNLLCILFTHFDLKRERQNKKVIGAVLWIMPVISVYSSFIFYSVLFGINVNYQIITSALFGILFIVMGNYMPKSKQNRTIGIKIRWTLANSDNWNATHRLAGKLWFFAGFFVLAIGFLPSGIFIVTFIISIFAIALVPVVYSYSYYKNNIKSGKQKEEDYDFKSRAYNKYVTVISSVIVVIALIACTVLTFTGGIEYELSESGITVDATYSKEEYIPYSEIQRIEYRENADKGERVMGFGSPRLLTGTFKNDEFGAYTRFSYTKCDDEIVMYLDSGIVVISAKTPEETRFLYKKLQLKLEG